MDVAEWGLMDVDSGEVVSAFGIPWFWSIFSLGCCCSMSKDLRERERGHGCQRGGSYMYPDLALLAV
jgi:hypothetical protein